MKITRDGKEYELTQAELWAAFNEQQHLNDIADVELNVTHYLSKEEMKTIGSLKEFYDDAAYALRSNIDDLGMEFDIALDRAIEGTKADYIGGNHNG